MSVIIVVMLMNILCAHVIEFDTQLTPTERRVQYGHLHRAEGLSAWQKKKSSCDLSHSSQLDSNRVFDCLSTSFNISGFEQSDDDEHLSDINNIWVLWTVEANAPNLRLTRIHLKRSVKQQSLSTACGIIFCPCP
jgi:hypothetical protein